MSQKVVRTNSDLLNLIRSLNATPAEKGSKKEAKLKKIAEKIKPLFDTYNEKREDIRLDNAYANEKGVLDLDDKGEYKFTKDGLKSLNKQVKELLNESFDFYQFSFSTESIEDLTFLEGWVEGIVKPTEEDGGQVENEMQ
jgi:hypothetical protein